MNQTIYLGNQINPLIFNHVMYERPQSVPNNALFLCVYRNLDCVPKRVYGVCANCFFRHAFGGAAPGSGLNDAAYY